MRPYIFANGEAIDLDFIYLIGKLESNNMDIPDSFDIQLKNAKSMTIYESELATKQGKRLLVRSRDIFVNSWIHDEV
ncbi:MAG: hypothetical protein KAS32_23645 [Candidatus Peribacteraceae bacterium]|nr:hypothetical protein [Candidatus Peribacteraceae bacterium]